MTKRTVYHGSHQIGGGCTEILSGGERILIDLGANLLDTNGLISDDELLFFKVFDGRSVNGLLLYASP